MYITEFLLIIIITKTNCIWIDCSRKLHTLRPYSGV